MTNEKKRYFQLLLANPDKNKTALEKIRVRKQRLTADANRHFEEAFRLLLESLDRNSIEFERIFVYIINLLRKMEEKDICYLKNMPNGRLRVFKTYYCCLGLKEWKKCPEYRCVIWPCYMYTEEECPHYEINDEDACMIESVEIVV